MAVQINSSAAAPVHAGTTATIGRPATLALLALMLGIGALPLLVLDDPFWTGLWSNDFWAVTVAATAWKCFRTARRLTGHERSAWLYISFSFAVYAVSQVIWAFYELILEIPNPVPSLADIGYFISPLLLVAGIWLYRTPAPSLGTTLIQLGNLGIIVAAILLVNLILLQDAFGLSTANPQSIVLLAYVVLATSVFFFALFNVGFYLHGRRRLVMAPLLCALACIALTDYMGSFALTAGTYSSGSFLLNWGYLPAFAFGYWAAFEQDLLKNLPVEKTLPPTLEERARRWEMMFPPISIAGLLLIAVARFEHLSAELVLPATGALLLFVASLGLRDWWNHRVETQLREQTEKSEARLQDSEARLLEKNQELADANRELWDEMQARMRVQEELRHSQKMEALGHLTGGVAHDFNNLLAVVLGNLELLEQRLDVDSQEYALAGEATGAAERGAALTQRLLAFSRKQKLTPHPVDARALLQDMRGMLESTLSEAIRLEIHTQKDLWHCVADSAQLENALLNLVINARDAMGAGGKIRIEASNLTLDESSAAMYSGARPGSYVAICVRDSGVGISADVLSKVFDPFFTTKEVGAGSGLGLSMVYGFAKQSGGFVSIRSEVDVGTDVQICLPQIQAPYDAAEIPDPGALPRGNGESVLLVEDEPMVRRLLVSLLESLGYAVIQAEDGAQALAILHEDGAVHAILSDVVLPGVYSGPDLIREVTRRRPQVKTLMMSGYADGALEHSAASLEGVQLLQKPFKKSDLARALRSVLDRK